MKNGVFLERGHPGRLIRGRDARAPKTSYGSPNQTRLQYRLAQHGHSDCPLGGTSSISRPKPKRMRMQQHSNGLFALREEGDKRLTSIWESTSLWRSFQFTLTVEQLAVFLALRPLCWYLKKQGLQLATTKGDPKPGIGLWRFNTPAATPNRKRHPYGCLSRLRPPSTFAPSPF